MNTFFKLSLSVLLSISLSSCYTLQDNNYKDDDYSSVQKDFPYEKETDKLLILTKNQFINNALMMDSCSYNNENTSLTYEYDFIKKSDSVFISCNNDGIENHYAADINQIIDGGVLNKIN